ncbi:hypothetical protein CJ193_001465 [Pseudoglutamicibacter albus]|uniref:Uncharacterized protein n=1 Tax=Pseudoglutamicibacter cumminsii TaxID=156979 RepID=A0AAP4FIM2_9MICC|nr:MULTISPECIES: hypothetical protein [Pseudoglutamicibacter]MCT1685924.1 hypothetical protein [Pseudoglutamicibacter cumminsii]MDK6275535.1 hypothetical protein [Pseudoglutamicibacter cumminsii]PKY80526.1 hypothetical protein CYJ35_04330 [Pseudoglutamicibacter albus]WIK84564.1 hypothetical protein CJ193_001465 [Pseudoglutamicibacter albus]
MFYSVQHPDATGTVSATNSAANDLSVALGELSAAFMAAGAALPHSPVVTNALAAVLMGAIEPASDSVINRVSTATSSTSIALNSYLQGDQQMGANVCVAPTKPDMPGVS